MRSLNFEHLRRHWAVQAEFERFAKRYACPTIRIIQMDIGMVVNIRVIL